MTPDLDQIKEAVIHLAAKHGAQQALLFGSYARGTATKHSDIDLMLVEATSDPFLSRMDRYLYPLVDVLKTSVEVLVYTPEEFERMKEGPFVGQALKEGIILYESGKIPRGGGTMAQAGGG